MFTTQVNIVQFARIQTEKVVTVCFYRQCSQNSCVCICVYVCVKFMNGEGSFLYRLVVRKSNVLK